MTFRRRKREIDSEEDVQESGKFESLAERLRTKARPSYKEDEEDEFEEDEEEEEEFIPAPVAREEPQEGEEYCPICGEGGKVLCCDGCPAVYHMECLDPPLKAIPKGQWFCAKCQSPLSELEKFLDVRNGEMRTGPGSSETKTTKQYLVKWKSKSHMHATWVDHKEIELAIRTNQGLKTKFNHFLRNQGALKRQQLEAEDGLAEAIRPEWTTVDRIICSRKTRNGGKEYLVKWKELGYDEATWEREDDIAAFQAEIKQFWEIESRAKQRSKPTENGNKRAKAGAEYRPTKRQRRDYKDTPKFLTGGALHPYQLEGLNWLRFAWQQRKHVILADEMGLGKTIQSIAFLASVSEEAGPTRPYLVVAPLSTLRNWEREFATWAPHMNVIMYVGSGPARAIIRQYEFFFSTKGQAENASSKKKKGKKKNAPEQSKLSKQERIKFDVLLASYEMINLDTSVLKGIAWECLIVDEGHRLKNKDSKLFQTLHNFNTHHRVLLTGTPLQNNLDELFMLMHFLDASKFSSLETFQEEFRDLSQEEQVGKLHKMLAPHLLRRLKKDVLKEMPPKKELIVRVELSPLQRTLYKAVLTRNYEVLARHGGHQVSLNNVVMELRKVCGHPYLMEGAESHGGTLEEQNRQLLEASGKLSLLDSMMDKLRVQGHRVLIYSQFTRVLDILEDWLTAKKWGYERIDGSIGGAERQVRIDRFNAPASSRFCFLLSTRAGGLGINLATADTVIIYDSDWNPHADLQAMARAHRLGQKGTVMIYRLITRGTIEERMMQLTKKKMVLEHLVVGRMKTNSMINQEELDDILRYGAQELFEEVEEAGKTKRIQYDEAAIDKLLDRSQVEHEEEAMGEVEESDYLKAFKVANFEYVDEEAAAAAAADEAERQAKADREAAELTGAKKAAYWDQLLRDKHEAEQFQKFVELGKGKRARKQVNYSVADDDNAGKEEAISDEDMEGMAEEESSTDEDMDDEEFGGRVVRKGGMTPPTFPVPLEAAMEDAGKLLPPQKKLRLQASPPALLEAEGRALKVLGFNQKQRSNFLAIVMRFGLGDFSWREYVPRLRPKTLEEIKEYGSLFLSHLAEDPNSSLSFSDGVPKEGLKVQEVLVRLALLHLIHNKVESMKKNPSQPLYAVDRGTLKAIGLRSGRVWTEEHDHKLLQGVVKHGYGRWQDTAFDPELGLQPVLRRELALPPPPPAPVASVRHLSGPAASQGLLASQAIAGSGMAPTQELLANQAVAGLGMPSNQGLLANQAVAAAGMPTNQGHLTNQVITGLEMGPSQGGPANQAATAPVLSEAAPAGTPEPILHSATKDLNREAAVTQAHAGPRSHQEALPPTEGPAVTASGVEPKIWIAQPGIEPSEDAHGTGRVTGAEERSLAQEGDSEGAKEGSSVPPVEDTPASGAARTIVWMEGKPPGTVREARGEGSGLAGAATEGDRAGGRGGACGEGGDPTLGRQPAVGTGTGVPALDAASPSALPSVSTLGQGGTSEPGAVREDSREGEAETGVTKERVEECEAKDEPAGARATAERAPVADKTATVVSIRVEEGVKAEAEESKDVARVTGTGDGAAKEAAQKAKEEEVQGGGLGGTREERAKVEEGGGASQGTELQKEEEGAAAAREAALLLMPGGSTVSVELWQQEIVATKKMTEFVKKRVGLLGKVLNVEYHQQSLPLPTESAVATPSQLDVASGRLLPLPDRSGLAAPAPGASSRERPAVAAGWVEDRVSQPPAGPLVESALASAPSGVPPQMPALPMAPKLAASAARPHVPDKRYQAAASGAATRFQNPATQAMSFTPTHVTSPALGSTGAVGSGRSYPPSQGLHGPVPAASSSGNVPSPAVPSHAPAPQAPPCTTMMDRPAAQRLLKDLDLRQATVFQRPDLAHLQAGPKPTLEQPQASVQGSARVPPSHSTVFQRPDLAHIMRAVPTSTSREASAPMFQPPLSSPYVYMQDPAQPQVHYFRMSSASASSSQVAGPGWSTGLTAARLREVSGPSLAPQAGGGASQAPLGGGGTPAEQRKPTIGGQYSAPQLQQPEPNAGPPPGQTAARGPITSVLGQEQSHLTPSGMNRSQGRFYSSGMPGVENRASMTLPSRGGELDKTATGVNAFESRAQGTKPPPELIILDDD